MRAPVAKTISDPIHGSIPLSDVEVAVINTQVFQRLRRIRQLGLAELVYPNADYSRFAHSLGACHLIGQIMDQLQASEELVISDGEYHEHRLALLLHDVGHYFGSHATEKPVAKFYDDLALQNSELREPEDQLIGLNHEDVGVKICSTDPELTEVLTSYGYDGPSISDIFTRNSESVLKNLVSSEMDADRLDYLVRSANATGLPYGNYDRDYLIQALRVQKAGDGDDRICIHPKALRAADHFLLCRTFDYLQVVYHKAVVGFELMLKECIYAALELGLLKLSERDILEALKNGHWSRWDDEYMRSVLVHMLGDERIDDPKLISMLQRVVFRQPAVCLFNYENLGQQTETGTFEDARDQVEKAFESEDAVRDLCLHWAFDFKPSKLPRKMLLDKKVDDQYLSERIYVQGQTECAPLLQHGQSLFKILGDVEYQMLRVYYVGAPGNEAEVCTALRKHLNLNRYDPCWHPK